MNKILRIAVLGTVAGVSLLSGRYAVSAAETTSTATSLITSSDPLASARALEAKVQAVGQTQLHKMEATHNPNLWEQVAVQESCANGGVNCVQGTGNNVRLTAPLFLGLTEQIGITPGTSGPPAIAVVECLAVTPFGDHYHIDVAGAAGGGAFRNGTSSGSAGVANGSPTSTAAAGYSSGAATTGASLVGQGPGFTRTEGADLANNVLESMIGGEMSMTVGSVVGGQDYYYEATPSHPRGPGPVTFTSGSLSCNAAGNSSSILHQGVNVLVFGK